MSDKQNPRVFVHSAIGGFLMGVLIPLIIIATIGFERPFWQLLIFGAALGLGLGLLFRFIWKR
jgi:hypothetical protein